VTLAPVSAWEAAAKLFDPPEPASPYLTDPALWVRKRLGEHLWSKQRDIAQAVVAHRRVAVKSCHNAGKSRLASRLAAWWIDVHPPGEAFVVSTAPSYPQVHAILWEEIRNAAKAATARGNPLMGRVLGSDVWKLDDGTLVGWGRKPADTDEHGFQGIHRRYVLVLIDEACGVPRQLWTAVEAITTNADCRILAIGNPDDPNTEFADVCKPGSGWNVIKISAFDTPNFTDEPTPDHLRPLMLDPGWVTDKQRRWGVESPRYVSKVLGEFPNIGVDTLISPALIEAAQLRMLEAAGRGILGVDVARYGTDRTVIYLRRGPVVRRFGEYSKQATTETTGRVIDAQRHTGAEEIRVDGVGVGAGVVDQLTEQGYGVLDMQAAAAAQDRDRFVNARAEWAWGMRERLEAGDLDLDPDDDELAAQLGAIKYRYNSRGQIVIESKDDMRKRGLPSPDHADAAILTAVRPAGVDMFPRLRWRSWAADGLGRVGLAGRSWLMGELWVNVSAHLPDGDDPTGVASALLWASTVDGHVVLLDWARARVADRSPFDLIRSLSAGRGADTTFVDRRQFPQVQRAGQVAAGVHVTPLNVDPEWLARALPASARLAAGKVWLPATGAWRGPFVAECLAFPNGRFDGAVATLALAVAAADTQWRPTAQPPAVPTHRDAGQAMPDPFGAGQVTDFMTAAL
jgi:phage terminase large subunit-like protein